MSHGQGESIDFDSITLPTDLVATVDREEDDIALDPGERDRRTGAAESEAVAAASGNAFSAVDSGDDVTLAASDTSPPAGESPGNVFSQIDESTSVTIAANEPTPPTGDSAGNVFSEVTDDAEASVATHDSAPASNVSTGNVFSQIDESTEVTVAASEPAPSTDETTGNVFSQVDESTGVSVATLEPVNPADDSDGETIPEDAEGTDVMAATVEPPAGDDDSTGNVFSQIAAGDESLAVVNDSPAPGTGTSGNVFSEVSTVGTEQAVSEEPVASTMQSKSEPGAGTQAAGAAIESATTSEVSSAVVVAAADDNGAVADTVQIPAESDMPAVGNNPTLDSIDIAMAGPVTGIPAATPLAPVVSTSMLDEESINEDEVILGWATAWSDNDTETYLSYYADAFVPSEPGQSREEWERTRRDRLQNQDIRIIVSNAGIHAINDGVVEVRFTQRYTSRSYKDRVIKSIEMVETDDGWKFLSENVVEELPFR